MCTGRIDPLLSCAQHSRVGNNPIPEAALEITVWPFVGRATLGTPSVCPCRVCGDGGARGVRNTCWDPCLWRTAVTSNSAILMLEHSVSVFCCLCLLVFMHGKNGAELTKLRSAGRDRNPLPEAAARGCWFHGVTAQAI